MKQWYVGMDCSSLEEVEQCGGRFFDRGKEEDVMQILKHYGANLIRLRLWNNPYSESGEPYGGGTNDFPRSVRLARRAAELGMDWLLDFHYSDFWTDPQKQYLPKAWRGMCGAELEQAVYCYTKETLQSLENQKLLPHIVSVGNEITNGLLWSEEKKPGPAEIARLVSAGIHAVKEVSETILVMIHLDNGGRNDLYRAWFDRYFEYDGADFDLIGLSYYPFWHGSLEDLQNNMNDLAQRYGKAMIVAETSMAFTLEDYLSKSERAAAVGRGLAVTPELAKRVPFPATPQGQADFLRALMKKIHDVPGQLGRGFIYWEPAWLPVEGSAWALEPGCKYIGETGSGGNEWANQALFDYRGNRLPALETIRDFYRNLQKESF